VEQETAIGRQYHGKHVSAAVNQHATVEELLEAVFSIPYAPRLCNEDWQQLCTQQAEVIQNHGNENVHSIGQSEARHRKYERPKLGRGQD
jgi:hypothetical protein